MGRWLLIILLASLLFSFMNHKVFAQRIVSCGCYCGKTTAPPCSDAKCKQVCGYREPTQSRSSSYGGSSASPSSGSSSMGPGSDGFAGNPFWDLGAAIRKSLFGDPAEKARKQAEEAQSAQEAAREAEVRRQEVLAREAARRAEEARKRQETYDRLSSQLQFATDFDERGDNLPLMLGDEKDAPRPEGTSFFGTGGAGSRKSANPTLSDEGTHLQLIMGDPNVVDLHDKKGALVVQTSPEKGAATGPSKAASIAVVKDWDNAFEALLKKYGVRRDEWMARELSDAAFSRELHTLMDKYLPMSTSTEVPLFYPWETEPSLKYNRAFDELLDKYGVRKQIGAPLFYEWEARERTDPAFRRDLQALRGGYDRTLAQSNVEGLSERRHRQILHDSEFNRACESIQRQKDIELDRCDEKISRETDKVFETLLKKYGITREPSGSLFQQWEAKGQSDPAFRQELKDLWGNYRKRKGEAEKEIRERAFNAILNEVEKADMRFAAQEEAKDTQ